MPGKTARLVDPRHDEAVACLSAGWTITATAEKVRVTRQTIAQWAKDPAHPVGAAMEALRAGVVARARGRLREMTDEAVSTLGDVLRDRDAPHAARIAAAREILSRAGVVETTRQEVAVDAQTSAAQAVARLARVSLDDLDAALDGDDAGEE